MFRAWLLKTRHGTLKKLTEYNERHNRNGGKNEKN
jgi:hypothetical protein